MMKYKGYSGVVEFDGVDRMFYGKVIGLRDVIGFEGDNVEELENSFHQAVDGYLELCKSRGKAPDKPYSGKFLVRVAPALHRKLVTDATSERMSLNEWVVETLEKRVGA